MTPVGLLLKSKSLGVGLSFPFEPLSPLSQAQAPESAPFVGHEGG